MQFDFSSYSQFTRIIIASIVIIVLVGVVCVLLGLISGYPQNMSDAILVMVGALFGNLMWEVLKKAMDG
jgi:hypothetical protein